MSETERIFMHVILAIEAKRGDMRGSTGERYVFEALDELEDDIREVAKTFGVTIPEPT